MSAPSRRPLVLCILDGFGIAAPGPHNAIDRARTPNWDRWWAEAPHRTLSASGREVGLPEGQFGNSEVGHLNLGAGRIVHQDILRISRAVEDGSLVENPALIEAFEHARAHGGRVHLLGLLSDGGVHSHLDHLPGLLALARERKCEDLFLHVFLDGRDTPPRSALRYAERLGTMIEEHGRGRVATVSGRYFAMDRDRRWERTERAYRAMVRGEGKRAGSLREAIERGYERDEDDEFVEPTVIAAGGEPVARIESGDACICFNFRPDRVRQITRALALEDCPIDRPERPGRLHYVCLTQYDATFPLPIAFPPEPVRDTLGDVYAAHGLTQLRLAETEKYAHVTYFFSGGREEPVTGEERVLIPSPQVATYDRQPEMSAPAITAALESALAEDRFDLVVMNYANPDMVGHTGDLEAAVRALETIDESLGRVADAVGRAGGLLAITADHGNAERMWDDEHDSPHTAHTDNPVPLVVLGDPDLRWREGEGALADVAPTLLGRVGLVRPEAMSGRDLVAGEAAAATRRGER